MEVKETPIKGLYVIEPKLFEDDRGYFYESFNEDEFNKLTGADFHPVQDNESKSKMGVFRGLHFQKPPYAQAKLVRVVKGSVIDFALDIRSDSPTYGKMFYISLSEDNHTQFFIPKGFAHGFVALSDEVIFQYKCDNYYNKESEDAIYAFDNGCLNLINCYKNCANGISGTYNKYDILISKGITNIIETSKNCYPTDGEIRIESDILLSDKDKNNTKITDFVTPF